MLQAEIEILLTLLYRTANSNLNVSEGILTHMYHFFLLFTYVLEREMCVCVWFSLNYLFEDCFLLIWYDFYKNPHSSKK